MERNNIIKSLNNDLGTAFTSDFAMSKIDDLIDCFHLGWESVETVEELYLLGGYCSMILHFRLAYDEPYQKQLELVNRWIASGTKKINHFDWVKEVSFQATEGHPKWLLYYNSKPLTNI